MESPQSSAVNHFALAFVQIRFTNQREVTATPNLDVGCCAEQGTAMVVVYYVLHETGQYFCPAVGESTVQSVSDDS